MFKRFRIAVLLYILLFVALGQFLASRRARDWDESLWINIHLINGSNSRETQAYIDSLRPDAFVLIEQFFDEQSDAYDLELSRPFHIRLATELQQRLPPVAGNGGFLSSIVFSLRMRWYVARLHWTSDEPTPDVTLFAVYHDAESEITLDRSTALRKGMIATANLFGSRQSHGSNQVVIAHEILHTLGATDKYDFATTLPLYPLGFADPNLKPLYPQSHAELMAGRVPIRSNEATVPRSLRKVVVGQTTAYEIGWQPNRPTTD